MALRRLIRPSILSGMTRSAYRGAAAYRGVTTLPLRLEELSAYRFDDEKMRSYFSPDLYDRFIKANATGADLSKEDKNSIANALYVWATSLGAVNFCHFFSPMRTGSQSLGGANALKLDGFIDLDYNSKLPLKPIVPSFSGGRLFAGETDGSSFPNGGLRATHTAAAFTSWDRGSPPWIRGDTLYIPAVFLTHYGAALDEKTPLLRSQDAVSEAAVRVLRLLGDVDTQYVVSNVGWEQEFFVIDKEKYLGRPDLRHCGRTLIGVIPHRNQQTEANYFGSVPPRVKAYLADVQEEVWRLGLSMVVMHNEVAPGQHEVSPIFSLTNAATDQNVMLLDVMHEIAIDHGLIILNHEKPFAGINGSGKHNNWGLNTDTGKNLFVPGKTPHAQQSFMGFVSALAYGLMKHGDVVRNGVAHAGNDHRLGAQEAPPAIISLYTGNLMEEHIRKIIAGGPLEGYGAGSNVISAGSGLVCPIPVGLEDRNRTAPFPFCGNRFEFRAVGSSQNIAFPLAMVNTVMADGLWVLAEKIESGKSVRDAVAEMFKENINIIFNGNGYSAEWREEAVRRGLFNLTNTVEAVEVFASEKNKKLFSEFKIFTPQETTARQVQLMNVYDAWTLFFGMNSEIMFENYVKTLTIEANTLVDMIDTGVLPAAAQDLARYSGSKLAGDRESVYMSLKEANDQLKTALGAVPDDVHAAAKYCVSTIKSHMSEVRKFADSSERLIAKDLYPFPSYTDILLSHHVDSPSK